VACLDICLVAEQGGDFSVKFEMKINCINLSKYNLSELVYWSFGSYCCFCQNLLISVST